VNADRRPLPVDEARDIARRAARMLAANPRIRLVYLFGSGAHGTGAARDVDLAILSDPGMSPDDVIRLRAALAEALRAPIDLVVLNDAPIVLAHEVVESGVCLHADPPEIETEFVTRTRARYWDFKPYRDEQWRLAGERLAARRGPQA
jgi:predicted nucleotidyltransferase